MNVKTGRPRESSGAFCFVDTELWRSSVAITAPSGTVATATLIDTDVFFRELGSLSCFRKGQGC